MKNDDDKTRFTKTADGRPALRVFVQLTEEDCAKLETWFSTRAAELKGDRWKGWCEVDMVMRTLIHQIDIFHRRAFGRPFPKHLDKGKTKSKS